MYLLNTSYKTKESIQYFTFIRIFKTQVWKELFNIFCVWMWLEGSEKPSIHSQPRYGLAEHKRNQNESERHKLENNWRPRCSGDQN